MTMPLLAVSGGEFKGEPLQELIDAALSVRASGVEVWYPGNFLATIPEMKRAFDAAQLSVVCVSTSSELGDLDHAALSASLLTEAIRVASELGAGLVNTYFGAPGYRDDERAITAFMRNLEPCLEVARAADVTIVLENEFNAFGRDLCRGDVTRRPESLRELVRRVGSRHFQLNFDAANYLCAGVAPFPYAFDLLRNVISYAHVKDVRRVDRESHSSHGWSRYTDYEHSYETTWLGGGGVGWDAHLEELAALPNLVAFTLEPHSQSEFRQTALQQSSAMLHSTLPHLFHSK